MSNAASIRDSLRKEVKHRLEEQIPVLGLPRLVAVDHMNQSLADARARVRDSHRVQMKQLGEKPEELDKGDDEMGISVAGDTYNITQPEPKVEPKQGFGVGTLAGAAGGAGLLLIAGLLLGNYLQRQTSPSPPNTISPADTEYDVRFYDKDGKLIDIPRRGPAP